MPNEKRLKKCLKTKDKELTLLRKKNAQQQRKFMALSEKQRQCHNKIAQFETVVDSLQQNQCLNNDGLEILQKLTSKIKILSKYAL